MGKRFKCSKAFTLMEMLVVIAIIGIILIIVIPSVSTVLNNRNKKLYQTHMLTVEAAAKTYVDQYEGQLVELDKECFNIDYSLLLKENLKESDIHCSGNVIINKVQGSRTYEPAYYLTCTDSNGEIVHKGDAKPKGCKGFNGKFKMSYGIYTDSGYTSTYDGSYYVRNAYVKFESTSPYNSPISHYEYSTSLDGNWSRIDNNSNLGTNEQLKNYVGTIYIRSVDEDGNTSTNEEFKVKMDNTGPNFSTSVSGNYLVKRLNIYDVSDSGVKTLAENAYSYDGGNTWVKEMSREYIENTTLQVCSRDNLDNRTCKTVEISGIDRVAPTITAISNKVYINRGDSKNIADYFRITYSPLGGTVNCTVSNTSNLSFGINTVTCTATGVNTLQASSSIVIAHQYSATPHCSGGRTLSNGSCVYSYTNNEAKCGCSIWKSCASQAECGVTNRTCRTESCGVASYNYCQHYLCGSHNKTCSIAACGEILQSCTNEAICGCETYKCTLYKRCSIGNIVGTCNDNTECYRQSNVEVNSGLSSCNSTCSNWCVNNHHGGVKGCSVPGAVSTGRQSACGTEEVTGSACNNANSKTCKTAKTCTSRDCGPVSYKTCSDPGCGTENDYCRIKECGVEQYNQCQHADCGSDINVCRNKTCGCETAASCTKTENEYRYYQCDSVGNNGSNGTLNSSTGICSF